MKPVKKLTEMQTAYVENRAAGVKRREAAVAAGYSAASADQQAYTLENREDIKRAIAAAKKRLKGHAKSLGINLPKEDDEDIPDRNKMPKATYSDAKEFLLDAMNHLMLPIAVRGDYAKALLPYQHGRVGETGKKQSQKERAKEITEGGSKAGAKPKYAPKSAPGGNVVAIRR